MSSMMEKISETLHIGGKKKEGDEQHKTGDKIHSSSAEQHKTHDHPAGAPCAPGEYKEGEHKKEDLYGKPAAEEKKHEGIMDKIKKKKKDRKERTGERKEGDSSSSSDSD